jgi:hypothetical protein
MPIAPIVTSARPVRRQRVHSKGAPTTTSPGNSRAGSTKNQKISERRPYMLPVALTPAYAGKRAVRTAP